MERKGTREERREGGGVGGTQEGWEKEAEETEVAEN